MPKIPHWYTIKQWKPELSEEFHSLARAIHTLGYDEFCYNRVYRYLNIGEFKYWTMSEIELMPRPQHVWLINRAKLDGST